MFSLNGQIALVTGGSQGIGRATALVLAQCGADVAVMARSLDKCEAVADEIDLLVHIGTVWTHGHSMAVPTVEEAVKKPFGDYGIAKAEVGYGGVLLGPLEAAHADIALRNKLVQDVWWESQGTFERVLFRT